jgi:hypothetical protein
MAQLLRLGSSGPEVAEIQDELNEALIPSPKLVSDGKFGTLTQQAVIRFQKENWLVADGIVGPCTRCALDESEEFVVLRPPAKLIPQPDSTTCWAASTAMLTNRTVAEVIAKSKAAGIDIDGGLSNDSEGMYYANTQLLAKTFNLTLRYPMSWLPQALAQLMENHGTLMMDTLWNVGDYTAGRGSPGHMRIIAGMRGDGTGEGTTVLLYDPWAPNVGKIESVIYGPFIRRDPASTYQIFHRR